MKKKSPKAKPRATRSTSKGYLFSFLWTFFSHYINIFTVQYCCYSHPKTPARRKSKDLKRKGTQAYYVRKVSRQQYVSEQTLMLKDTSPTHVFEIITEQRARRYRRLAEKLAAKDKISTPAKYNLWTVQNAGRALNVFFTEEKKHKETYWKEIKQKKKRPPAPSGQMIAMVPIDTQQMNDLLYCRVLASPPPRSTQ
jgi:hypothetical protein